MDLTLPHEIKHFKCILFLAASNHRNQLFDFFRTDRFLPHPWPLSGNPSSGHALIKVVLSQLSGMQAIKAYAALLLFCLTDKDMIKKFTFVKCIFVSGFKKVRNNICSFKATFKEELSDFYGYKQIFPL